MKDWVLSAPARRLPEFDIYVPSILIGTLHVSLFLISSIQLLRRTGSRLDGGSALDNGLEAVLLAWGLVALQVQLWTPLVACRSMRSGLNTHLRLLIILVVRGTIGCRQGQAHASNHRRLFLVLLGLELAGQLSALGCLCRLQVGVGFGHFSVNLAEFFLGLYRH